MVTLITAVKTGILKPEHRAIIKMVRRGASVLDLGCGDGSLMLALTGITGARAQGIEIDEKAIYTCVGKGLSVIHGDIDSGLAEYPDRSFDYVILNQSLQQVRDPGTVLNGALRVGGEVIVGVPNFAYYPARVQLALKGRVPVTSSLPYEWYNTPNTHFLSLADFIVYCRRHGMKIKKSAYLSGNRQIHLFPNLFADTGIFLITRKDV